MNLGTDSYDPVVVIPAFRRAASLKRLLESIQKTISDALPRVIVSLEGGASNQVKKIALEFHERYENSMIIEQSNKLGLREHIIFCGNLAIEYGSVIILEDDLLVDPYFYQYAKQALLHYHHDDSISGIALYAPEFNEFSGFPFRPIRGVHDTYLMRTPCSWGQVWSRKHWKMFKEWYDQPNVEELLQSAAIPSDIKRWPNSSWKKYFAAYMSTEKRDFVYPYEAFSTNCADPAGTHMKNGSILYQVGLPLPIRAMRRLTFCNRDDTNCVSYDEYMESNSKFIYEWLGLKADDVTIDLYGTKPQHLVSRSDFVVTTKRVRPYEKKISVSFRPIERNLMPTYSEKSGQNDFSIYLARSIYFRENTYSLNNIGAYSYFSGINLRSLKVFLAVSSSFPRLLFNTAHHKLRRILKIW
jgi:hypothetical protein